MRSIYVRAGAGARRGLAATACDSFSCGCNLADALRRYGEHGNEGCDKDRAMADDLTYFLRRAEQEAISAIAALHPGAAAAHRRMSRLYSSAALLIML